MKGVLNFTEAKVETVMTPIGVLCVVVAVVVFVVSTFSVVFYWLFGFDWLISLSCNFMYFPGVSFCVLCIPTIHRANAKTKTEPNTQTNRGSLHVGGAREVGLSTADRNFQIRL